MLCFWSLFLSSPSGAGELRSHTFWISRDYEEGVINRGMVEYQGRYWLSPVFAIDGGAALSLVQQWGVSRIGVAGVANFPNAKSYLILGVEHETWPDWRVTENRASLYWEFHPLDLLTAVFGFSYRSPQFMSTTLAQALAWGGAESEIAIVYRLEWHLFTWGRLRTSMAVWDYDRMLLYTSDNIHFSFRAEWSLNPQLRLMGQASTAAKGVSGGLLSWGQNELAMGLNYEL